MFLLLFSQQYGGINDVASEGIELETVQKYNARWKSIWVLYMTMFFSSVGKRFCFNIWFQFIAH